ncbi:hypothetical protein ACK9YZ_20240 [Rhizobium sp. ZK1]|uniref:hypothetical protein n=1 Tax=Rhizobium sp. ZK1 TaxID=3389872 RepID=UPI0039F67F47
MRPQRKPFVVEIEKTKQLCRKPVPAEANRPDAAMKAGTKMAVGLAVRSEGRA